jgi:competence protein ComGF
MDKFTRKGRDDLRECTVGKNDGFTYIELLIVIIILMTITSLFPLLFTIIAEWTVKPSSLHPFEWEIAVSQLTMEIREAEEVTIENGSLRLRNIYQDVIQYERYGHVIRRRVNGQGHEVILQNIDRLGFFYITNGIRIFVVDLDGHVYEKKIHRWSDTG